jgi:hypothetical protein
MGMPSIKPTTVPKVQTQVTKKTTPSGMPSITPNGFPTVQTKIAQSTTPKPQMMPSITPAGKLTPVHSDVI